MIKCGHCGDRHDTINEVRECAPAGGGIHASVWTARFWEILIRATGDTAEQMMGILKWILLNRSDIPRGSAAMHHAAVLLYTRKITPTQALQARFA